MNMEEMQTKLKEAQEKLEKMTPEEAKNLYFKISVFILSFLLLLMKHKKIGFLQFFLK